LCRVKAFVRKTIKNFQSLWLGYRISDKLRVLGIAVLQLVPWTIRKRIPGFEKIERIACRSTLIEVDGIKYILLDFESLVIASREFESFVSMWLEPRRGEVLVDIGAHMGRYTLTTAKVVGNEGMVVAIEPHPENCETLQRNIRLNRLENVIVLNFAAWDTDCELKLFTGDVAGHHSVRMNRRLGWVKVKGRVMDRVLKELNLGRVDWIKIDVEGAECEVLYGLEETISRYTPKIIVEVFQENVGRIKRFMKEQGYGLIRISPHVWLGAHYFLCAPFS
jgi:FkbM family methyltransferase